MPGAPRLIMRAMISPMIISKPTALAVKISVFLSTIRKRASWSKRLKLLKPVKFGGVSTSHLQRERVNAAIVGPAIKMA
ncbi:hypothetical protein ES703_122016 [subsurface metagenome]